MGVYLNPGNISFQRAVKSEIYVDKTNFIRYTNKIINTENRFLCVSRPRRFGKSITANMLTAYYSKGCDSAELFSHYQIAAADSFTEHLNQYHVIHINMIDFINRSRTIQNALDYLSRRLLHELKKEFQGVDCFDWNDLTAVLQDIFQEKKTPFVIIIDEWDCVFRIHKSDRTAQILYLDFLRNLLKDKEYVGLAYMTGILPIKKYGEHSALNMFTEISMTDPREYAEFTGFTENEVRQLCEQYQMPFEDTRRWYDGYRLINGVSVYNPRSVVMSMTGGYFNNYWTATETYEALKIYIQMNFDGLKEKVSELIAGGSVPVNPGKFQNDMTTFETADDVLTLLIHLGYLTFDMQTSHVWIPNAEVQQEFLNSIEDGGWEHVMKAVRSSDELLKQTLAGNAQKVAEMITAVHDENTSVLKYNDENSLSCVISLAYYTARKNYILHREFPTGQGFADIVFIPQKNCDMPALLIELKKGKSAQNALKQIKNRKYSEKVSQYTGDMLLIGINYDENKKHTCVIEKIHK